MTLQAGDDAGARIVTAADIPNMPELLSAVWGPEYRSDFDYLRSYIHLLRRKLEPDPANPKYIIRVPGVGYMLDVGDR